MSDHIPAPHPTDLAPRLLPWFEAHGRDMPWRLDHHPYRLLVAVIMLQQTQVATVIPYHRRFLRAFPSLRALAVAPVEDVLKLWEGLGYYSRARNLRRAARQIVSAGTGFPRDYAALRALPGVGDYTAAAVASIAFGLPHAVIDGNVRRVLSRLECRGDGLPELAARLLDRADPGAWNQALMELGATVCLPREPRCERCPLSRHCQARREGRQAEFPPSRPKPATVRAARRLLLVERRGRILLTASGGFWDIPDSSLLPGAEPIVELGRFRHSIMNRSYVCTVYTANVRTVPAGFRWAARTELSKLPIGTLTRKAFALAAGKLSRSR